MNIEILPIIKEDFLKIPKDNLTSFVNFVYTDNLNGIYYDSRLLGLVGLSPTFNNLSIDIMILPKYRHLGIATYVLSKIILDGQNYPNYEKFICLCSPKNIASNKLMQKLKWSQDTSYDDVMLNEGGEFFYIYYHNNPFFQKLMSK